MIRVNPFPPVTVNPSDIRLPKELLAIYQHLMFDAHSYFSCCPAI
ncbi:hypothetical protein AM1_0121 [Acaryochloris marina MBIC11017]|uniref:Uncharacterized protein n=1 Tax=Acaryochloris marina (strain MBIC 11017) TaxID=329726 RepID=B0C6B4_ACAM1|nr:hypothetical protein AM1_0121 [Acaryochloris marina MBIC11017]